jgi:hypothetical protein
LCTFEEYYSQFDTARDLEVGRIYANNVGSFNETTYTIVYIDHGVALGIESHKGVIGRSKYQMINAAPKRALFKVGGNNSGWKLNDPRPSFRLREINP